MSTGTSRGSSRGSSPIRHSLSALEEEKQTLIAKKERAKQEREDGLLEQNARLLQQLQEQRDKASNYKLKISQLKDEKQIEIARRQQCEIDLATTRADADELRSDLESKTEENNALNDVNSSIKMHKSLSHKVADAVRMAEIASRERDRAKDKVAKLEARIRDMQEQIHSGQLDQRQVLLQNEIKSKQEQLVNQMKLQMKEDQREFRAELRLKEKELTKLRDAQKGGQLKAEQERDAALREARVLREKANQFRADTRELERQLYEASKMSQSPTATSRGTASGRETASPPADMVGGLNAAIRIVHLEADVQRLRNQLHAKESEHTAASDARTKALQNQLDFCKRQLEIGPPQPTDTSMLETLYTRQQLITAFRASNAHLRDFVSRAASGQASPAEAWQTLALSDTAAIESLPHGWEQKQTEDGIDYYLDHSTRTSTWVHPNLIHYAAQPSILTASPGSATPSSSFLMRQHHSLAAGPNVSVVGDPHARRPLQAVQSAQYPPAQHETKARGYANSARKLQEMRNKPRSAGAGGR